MNSRALREETFKVPRDDFDPRRDTPIKLRTILVSAVALGLCLRVVKVIIQAAPDAVDGTYYTVMGATFAQHHAFIEPWDPTGSAYGPQTAHLTPMWPLVLAFAYTVGGYSFATSMVTSFLASILSVAVVFLATKNLFGAEKAWVVTATVSLDFQLISYTGFVFSENLLEVFFVGTIWAILRSLKDGRYIILAGLLAGAGYLTKASVGYFFILAGAAGFLWRFYYMGRRVLRDRYYLIAISIFLTFVGGWALRNILDFGWPHWETSPYTQEVIAYAFSRPLQFLPVLAAKILLFFTFFATLGLFFAPQILRAGKQWRIEAVSALLLAVFLPAILGLLFATSFALYESWSPLFWDAHLRYVIMALVPLMWLALREEAVPTGIRVRDWLSALKRPRFPPMKSILVRLAFVGLAGFAFYEINRMVGLLVLFGAIIGPRVPQVRGGVVVGLVLALALTSVNAATQAAHSPEDQAGRFLAAVTHDDDVIAVAGNVDLVSLYPFLANRNITFVQWNKSGNEPAATFVLSNESISAAGYELSAIFNSTGHYGLLDLAYFAISKSVRGVLGMSLQEGPPSAGELFLYRLVQ